MIFIYLPLRREDWSKIPSSGLTLSTMEQVAGHTKFLECIEEILHMPSLVVRILGIQCCSLCLALTTLNLALAALICLRSGSAAVLDGPVLHLLDVMWYCAWIPSSVTSRTHWESLVRFYDAEEDQTHGFIIALHHHCIIVSLCCCHVCVCHLMPFDSCHLTHAI